MTRTQAPAPAAGDGQADVRPGRAETALLRAVLHFLFGVWGLSAREVAPMLGGVPLRELFHWRERPESARIDVELRYRLSALLALYKALRRRHPDGAAQREWLRTPGADERTPVELMMDGRTDTLRSLRERALDGADGDETAGSPR